MPQERVTGKILHRAPDAITSTSTSTSSTTSTSASTSTSTLLRPTNRFKQRLEREGGQPQSTTELASHDPDHE
jgi:hypothetical protein